MIVSPLDYELYSRVTGQPIPMSAAERMKMAPVVNEFTKNYNKSRGLGAIGKNVLKIGAIGAGLGAAYLAGRGSRDFGTPSQELGQDLVETSTASNLIQKAADNAAASTATNTISQSISTNQTPEQTLENAAETSTPPSQLNINESAEQEEAPLLSEDAIRKKYTSSRVKNPERRARELESDMIGSASSGPDMLKNFISGMTKKERSFAKEDGLTDLEDTSLQSEGLAGDKGIFSPIVDDSSSILTDTQYGAFASPLKDHPDMEGGEDDAGLPGGNNNSGGTNTSATVKITKDPKTVGIASSLPKTVGKTPEEKMVIASIVNEKRQPSPNELAGKDQATFEALTGEPSQQRKIEADQARSRVEQKTAAKQRMAGMQTPLTDQYYPTDVARTDIQVGGMKDRKTGLGRSVGISYTPLNGDTKVGFSMMPNPENPTEVKTYDFKADQDAVESMKVDDKFSKLFNLATKRKEGFSSYET